MEEINDRLLEISKQTGKQIINAQIEKAETEFEITKEGEVKEKGNKYKSSYTKFTGEKHDR